MFHCGQCFIPSLTGGWYGSADTCAATTELGRSFETLKPSPAWQEKSGQAAAELFFIQKLAKHFCFWELRVWDSKSVSEQVQARSRACQTGVLHQTVVPASWISDQTANALFKVRRWAVDVHLDEQVCAATSSFFLVFSCVGIQESCVPVLKVTVFLFGIRDFHCEHCCLVYECRDCEFLLLLAVLN